MTDIKLRPAEPDRDADAIIAMMLETYPFIAYTAETIAYRLHTAQEKDRPLNLMADIDGRAVGHGSVSLDPDLGGGHARFLIFVDAGHRGRGVGTALYQPMLEHARAIGATKLTARTIDRDTIEIAAAHGFGQSRVERISHVALDRVPPPVEVPDGIRVVSQSALDDFRAMHELDGAVIADIPSDSPFQELPYDEWLLHFAHDPGLDADSTVVAFDGDLPVALAWLNGKGERVWSGMTGVRPEYRGRGLAKLVKTHALDRARRRGATDAYTNNDSTNAGMLAVNDWLGYRLFAEQHTLVRTLD